MTKQSKPPADKQRLADEQETTPAESMDELLKRLEREGRIQISQKSGQTTAIVGYPGPPQQYTAAEQDFIATLERWKGRKPTQQEINLALDQARAIGEL